LDQHHDNDNNPAIVAFIGLKVFGLGCERHDYGKPCIGYAARAGATL
jgi:hypothetical protein